MQKFHVIGMLTERYYIQGETWLKMRIFKDFKATNKCRLLIAKEPLFPDRSAFAIAKSDPMLQIVDYEWVYNI